MKPDRSTAGIERSVTHSFFYAPLDILRYGLALGLRQRCEHGSKHLTGDLAGVDAFFLKVHAYAARFQRTHRFEALGGVSGKSGYGLHEDPVYESALTVTEHALEIIALFYRSACDTLIGIDVYKLPVILAGYKLGIVAVLCGKGV